MDMQALKKLVSDGFDRREEDSFATGELRHAVATAMKLLDAGEARVAEPVDNGWKVHEWLKKAVLLSFRLQSNECIEGAASNFYDKVPLKYAGYTAEQFRKAGVRVVPDALVRYGAHVERDVVLMPSYVNVGARIGSGTLVDTWATVGSCAQIGRNVHLSGGVGIGGVLEPVQAAPTIIEDNCFIGARSEIVEGVVVGAGSVISMGVYIGQSTRIYDRSSGQISYGRIPPGSVVVSGNLPAKDGSHSLYCAVIVKQVDEKTRSKTGLNELLRLTERD